MPVASVCTCNPYRFLVGRNASRRVHRRVTPVVLAIRQQNDGLMVDNNTLRNLSPEARRVFQEAQENILEINKGRIRALEELKVAKKRIAELEQHLEEALQDADQAAAQVEQFQTPPAAYPAYTQPAAQAVQEQYVQATPPPPPPPPTPSPAPAVVQPPAVQQPPPPQQPTNITIVYSTSWGTAFLHYNADGKGWTTLPGTRMEEGQEEHWGKKVLQLDCKQVEFVATNGKNDWDHPDQYQNGGSKNYTIRSPGVYFLKSGKLTQLS